MDDRSRAGLRDSVLLLFEISQSINAELATRVDPAMGANSSVTLTSALAQHGPLRPTQLGQLLGLTAPGVSSLLRRAEKAKCIRRDSAVPGSDGRGVVVSLTPQGRRMVASVDEGVHAAFVCSLPRLKDMLAELEMVLGDDHRPPVGSALAPTASMAELLFGLGSLGTELSAAWRGRVGRREELDTSALVALFLVDSVGPCRPSHVADRLHLSSGGVSRLLDRLDALDLAVRRHGTDSADRRAIMISLTDAGVAAVTRSTERMAPLAPRVYALFRDALLSKGLAAE